MENQIIRARNKVTVNMERQDIVKFLGLFTRKTNTIFRTFDKKIYVKKEDVCNLIKSIDQLLKSFHVNSYVSSAIIKFYNSESMELKSLNEFIGSELENAAPIENINLTWNFLYSSSENSTPDKYNLSVRLANSLTPLHFLQKLVSFDQDEIDSLDQDMAPCLVRVDFINPKISETLVDEVAKWNKGLLESVVRDPFILDIKKYFMHIARIINYIPPLSTLFISFGAWYKLSKASDFNFLGYWMLITFTSLYITYKIGYYTAASFVRRISNISRTPVFNITKGDNTLNDKIEKECIKAKKAFWFTAFGNLVYGVSSGLIASFLFELIKKV